MVFPQLHIDAFACTLPFGMWIAQELQNGIDRYTEEHGTRFEPFWTSDKFTLENQPWLKGMIAFVPDLRVSSRFEHLGCPVVNVSSNLGTHAFPSVLNDGAAMGRCAVEHMVTCGASRLYYVHHRGPNRGYRKQRMDGALEAGKHLGIHIQFLEIPRKDTKDRHEKLLNGVTFCSEWLQQTTPPVSVIASGPTEAQYFSLAAETLGWTLGQEMALIQLTDPREHLWHDTSHISCIPHDWRQVGYLSAERLVNWVDKGLKPKEIEWVPPLPPNLTPSSDPSIGSDLATRVHSLLQHSSDYGLRVEDIADEFGVSTSTLYRAVKRKTGQNLKTQIRDRKLSEIKRLLLETNLAVEDIAARCGYRSVQTLTAVFKQEFGAPPGQWRLSQPT